MEGSTSRSHDSGGAGAAQETLATAEPAEVAVNATAVAVAGAAGGATKLVPLATIRRTGDLACCARHA